MNANADHRSDARVRAAFIFHSYFREEVASRGEEHDKKSGGLVFYCGHCSRYYVDVSCGQDVKKEGGSSFRQSEDTAKKYLDAFRENGVPTSDAVDVAFKQAESANTIPAWLTAARLANSYANVVDVLREHYSKLFRGKQSLALIEAAADYERTRNAYLGMRNRAYLRIAQLHLAKKDQAQALSFAVTAVELSGVEPNKEGEALIKQIIEYKP